MEDHDVLRMHELDQLERVGDQGLVVDLVLGGTQRTTVSREPVQAIVNALGDQEELGIPGDHRPSGVDAHASAISEQGAQHLGDAAAVRGRVHVPDDAAVEPASGFGDQVAQRLELPYREHRLEAQGIHRVDIHMLQGWHIDPLLRVDRLGLGGRRMQPYLLLPGAAIAAWAAATRAIGTRNGEQLT